MTRAVSQYCYDDGLDRWSVASAAPAPALAGLVDRYTWWTERTHSFTTRRELAATTGVLIVNLGSALEIVDASGTVHRLGAGQGFVGGIARSTSLSRSTGEMAGVHVHLAPDRLARLLGLPLAALTDRCFALHDLLGLRAAQLGEELLATTDDQARWSLLDRFVAERAALARAADRAMDYARAALSRGTPVQQVADTLDMSRKRLAARFRDATGLHPRSYAGLARFERFAKALPAASSLADAAIDAGYADQPHLTREVARYAALTPAALRARLIPAGGGVRE